MPTKSKEKNSLYHRNWYIKNIQKRKDDVRKRRNEIRDRIRAIKQKLGCSRCPENHPAALDFHHINDTIKKDNLANAAMNGWGIVKINTEIKKCIILCSNCHRKEHYKV